MWGVQLAFSSPPHTSTLVPASGNNPVPVVGLRWTLLFIPQWAPAPGRVISISQPLGHKGPGINPRTLVGVTEKMAPSSLCQHENGSRRLWAAEARENLRRQPAPNQCQLGGQQNRDPQIPAHCRAFPMPVTSSNPQIWELIKVSSALLWLSELRKYLGSYERSPPSHHHTCVGNRPIRP